MDNDLSQKDSGSSNALAWTLVIVMGILLVIAVIIIFLLYGEKSSSPEITSQTPAFNSPTRTLVNTPIPTPASKVITLDKKYLFPIRDGVGTKVGDISFVLKDIERTKEVMVSGQKAVAVGDRELVIFNLELTNYLDIAAVVNARNYFRLKVNGQDKLLAPEFHSDPIDLQPKSSKDIRMGFSIAQSDKDIILQVGELTGPKDNIPVE